MNFRFGFEPIVDVVVRNPPVTLKDFICTDSDFLLQVFTIPQILESNWLDSDLWVLGCVSHREPPQLAAMQGFDGLPFGEGLLVITRVLTRFSVPVGSAFRGLARALVPQYFPGRAALHLEQPE